MSAKKHALEYPSEYFALRGIVTIKRMVNGGWADECLELNSCAKKDCAAVFIRNDLARTQIVPEGLKTNKGMSSRPQSDVIISNFEFVCVSLAVEASKQ